MATKSKHSLQLSEGYRSARRLVSVLCALGLGWSTAQYEVKSLNLSSTGVIDLSTASISLVLACCIAFMSVRCMIEYAMQPEEVRQWQLAQTDFRLSLFLVQFALLMLAAGGLNRSVETVAYVIIGSLVILVGSLLLIALGTMALMPFRMWLRSRQGRISAASSVAEAEGWSMLIVIVLVIALVVALGVASIKYEPLLSMWTTTPRPMDVAIFVAAAIAVVISLVTQGSWIEKLFATPPHYTETKMPDGTTRITFHNISNGQQDKS